jgi:phosphate-selective porin OprO/OprP
VKNLINQNTPTIYQLIFHITATNQNTLTFYPITIIKSRQVAHQLKPSYNYKMVMPRPPETKIKILITTASLLPLAITAQANAGTVTSKGDDIVMSSNSGLKVVTADGDKSFAIGGRLQGDYINLQNDGENVFNNTHIRRVRIYFKGRSGNWAYKSPINFDDNKGTRECQVGTVEDLYITFTGFGSATNITEVKHNPSFSLQQLSSSNDISGLERSESNNLFTSARHTGLQLHSNLGMLTCEIGVLEG